jgi:hypothetical protein
MCHAVFFDWVHETLLPPEHMREAWTKWGVPDKRAEAKEAAAAESSVKKKAA